MDRLDKRSLQCNLFSFFNLPVATSLFYSIKTFKQMDATLKLTYKSKERLL